LSSPKNNFKNKAKKCFSKIENENRQYLQVRARTFLFVLTLKIELYKLFKV